MQLNISTISISFLFSDGKTVDGFSEEITATVLVTGASGYIANHVVELLLEAGHKVRGSVRSKASEKAKALYALAGEARAGQLELVEADLVDEESWIP